MTRIERIASIRHWRQCEMLEQPFFSIKCGSTAMDTVSFGELIDFLLDCTQPSSVELDAAYAEIERLKTIEISYRDLEKRFIAKCDGDNNRWQGDKDAE